MEANANDLVDQVWIEQEQNPEGCSTLQMIAELVEDQKLAVLELGDQVIRRKFRIGFLRPRLDLNITKPVVTGLSSLKRTSEAVMEYSEVDEMPNFNVKFNAQLSNVNAKGGIKGKVSRIF